MYKLHNNIGLIRGHALLQIRNFFPKDNAISRIIGTLQFLSADTSTILRLFLLLRSISITDDDNFIIFASKLSSEHFSINQFQYTLHISSLINSSSTITELTWTSSRGTCANARNTNKSSRSSKQRKCGQGRNSHRPLQKEEEEEKNPLRSEFPPVPSNGNFSSPRAFSLPASAVFPREPRAISFPYIAYTIPSPPLEARPRPTSAVEHRPLLVPLFLLRVEEGRVRAETARGVGVVPGASHQRRRPTDRPTVPTERSPLSQASIKPGAVERVVPILPSAIGAHAPLPHPLRAQHASNATSSSTSRAGVAAERGCVQQHGGSTKSTSGRTEKNGAYAESHESRIDREINGWTWSRVQ